MIPKTDQSGLDIYIKANTKGEQVHIPVAISMTGLTEDVYNDFHIGDNADVIIIAGCGIYNCGPIDSVHNGIHRFQIGKTPKSNTSKGTTVSARAEAAKFLTQSLKYVSAKTPKRFSNLNKSKASTPPFVKPSQLLQTAPS